jgi:hypothetical protein
LSNTDKSIFDKILEIEKHINYITRESQKTCTEFLKIGIANNLNFVDNYIHNELIVVDSLPSPPSTSACAPQAREAIPEPL